MTIFMSRNLEFSESFWTNVNGVCNLRPIEFTI